MTWKQGSKPCGHTGESIPRKQITKPEARVCLKYSKKARKPGWLGGVSTEEIEEVRSERQWGPDSGGPFKDFGFYSELD